MNVFKSQAQISPLQNPAAALDNQISALTRTLKSNVYLSDISSINKALNQIRKDSENLKNNDDSEHIAAQMTTVNRLLAQKTVTPTRLETIRSLFNSCIGKTSPGPLSLKQGILDYQMHRLAKAPENAKKHLAGFTQENQVLILDYIQNLSEADQERWCLGFQNALERTTKRNPMNGDEELLKLKFGAPLPGPSRFKLPSWK